MIENANNDTSLWHDDVTKWKHFPRYWPFVQGIHRSPVNSPDKGQWCGTLKFSLICLNKRLSKQSWGWWFETLSCPLWRHCNVYPNNSKLKVLICLFSCSRGVVAVGIDLQLLDINQCATDGSLFADTHNCQETTKVRLIDDFMAWKCCLHYWPFVRGIPGSRWIPLTKEPVVWSSHAIFVVCIFKLLNSRCATGLRRHDTHVTSLSRINQSAHLGLTKIPTICKTTPVNTFSWYKMFALAIISLLFHQSLFPEVQKTMCQHCFR